MQKVPITGKEIVNRIDLMLKSRNEKRKSLADEVGISLQPFTSWANRGSIPSADTAYYISKFLGVSLEWLLTGQDVSGLSDGERTLVDKWRRLTGTEKARIETVIDFDLSHFHAIQ